MSEGNVAVLLEDPELGEQLSAQRAPAAHRDCVAPAVRLRRGLWDAQQLASHMRFGVGLLVLEGLLTRRVGLDGRFGAELLGSGDLLSPWQEDDGVATLPYVSDWRVLSPCRVALLDSEFTLRAARYPEVLAALFARAIRRGRQLAVNMAIVHQPRIDVRLHMFFWHLAERWGTVHHDGVHVSLRLTHSVLAELIAARRPTVTKALSELAARDAVRWSGETWLLSGPPPLELREVGEFALAHRRMFAEATDGQRRSPRALPG